MNITEKSIIGEVVAEDYRAASVFKSYGIDFCCTGNRSIAEACEKKNLNSPAIVERLKLALQQTDGKATDYASWPIDLLADYIEKKHHRYVEAKTQEIKPFLQKVVRVHGGHHPELIEIEQLFLESAGDLAIHMKKEELILFPFIRKMMQSVHQSQPVSTPHFGTIENPISMMKQDHTEEGERFRKIAALANNYQPPQDACNTFKVTYALLKEFEEDLHLHIHLENNILFPKAIDLEKEIHVTA